MVFSHLRGHLFVLATSSSTNITVRNSQMYKIRKLTCSYNLFSYFFITIALFCTVQKTCTFITGAFCLKVCF